MNIINGLRHQVDGMIGSELERKVKEATSDQNWNASSSLKNEISEATYHYEGFNQVLPIIWKRLGESGPNWRMVFKALVLLEHLIIAGSEKVVTEARDAIYQIRSLQNFSYTDEDGRNRGQGVMDMSRKILDMLEDDQRLREERNKAKAMRDRLSGVATTGFGSAAGGGGRYAGFSGGSAAAAGGRGGGGGARAGFDRRSAADAYGGRIDQESHPSSMDLSPGAAKSGKDKSKRKKKKNKKKTHKRREASDEEDDSAGEAPPAPSGSEDSDSEPTRRKPKKKGRSSKRSKKKSGGGASSRSRDLAFSDDEQPQQHLFAAPTAAAGSSKARGGAAAAATGPDWGAFDNGDGWGDFEDGSRTTTAAAVSVAPRPVDDLAAAFAGVDLSGAASAATAPAAAHDDSWGSFGGVTGAPAPAAAVAAQTSSADDLFFFGAPAAAPAPAASGNAPTLVPQSAADPFGAPFSSYTGHQSRKSLQQPAVGALAADDVLFASASSAPAAAAAAVPSSSGVSRTAMGGGTSHIKGGKRVLSSSSSAQAPAASSQIAGGLPGQGAAGSIPADAWSKGSGLIDLSSLSKPSFAAFDPSKPAGHPSSSAGTSSVSVHAAATNSPLPDLGAPLYNPAAAARPAAAFNGGGWGATGPIMPPNVTGFAHHPQSQPHGLWPASLPAQQRQQGGAGTAAAWPAGLSEAGPGGRFPSNRPFNM